MSNFFQGRWPGFALSTVAALIGAMAAGSALASEAENAGAAVTTGNATESTTLPDWSTFQGNAAHTGFVPVKLDAANFAKRWEIPINAVLGSFVPGVASIATSNNLVYVSGGNKLKAYSETDGSLVWVHSFNNLPNPSVNPPAVSKGVVYVAAGQQDSTYMFAFDASNGSKVFQSQMSSQWENYLAPTIAGDGIFTNAGAYGGLYGFSRDGSLRFFAQEQQQSLWTPAADKSGVYSYTGYLQVVDPKTGAVTHQIQDSTFDNYTYVIGGSPVLGTPGTVFVANYVNAQLNGGDIGNTLLAFSLQKNSISWKVPGAYPTTPAYAGGLLYATNNRPFRLEVRAESDGALNWSWTPPAGSGDQFVSEVLLTQTFAFVSTNVATYAINLKKQKSVWSYPMAGKLAMSKSGILYIQGSTTLTAIKVM